MVNNNYSIAYSEVLEILKYIPLKDYRKIPREKIELFKLNADKNHVFNYNPRKTLDEQNVSKTTKGIIAIMFRDYWATPNQREKIIKKQNSLRKEIEIKKLGKYDVDVFKIKKNVIQNKQFPSKIESKKWYQKCLDFIKNFLKIK